MFVMVQIIYSLDFWTLLNTCSTLLRKLSTLQSYLRNQRCNILIMIYRPFEELNNQIISYLHFTELF